MLAHVVSEGHEVEDILAEMRYPFRRPVRLEGLPRVPRRGGLEPWQAKESTPVLVGPHLMGMPTSRVFLVSMGPPLRTTAARWEDDVALPVGHQCVVGHSVRVGVVRPGCSLAHELRNG